jgi:hypothetical protein
VRAILTRDLDHPRAFVRAWAVDALATLSADDPASRRVVLEHLDRIERSASKALRARARQIRLRIS